MYTYSIEAAPQINSSRSWIVAASAAQWINTITMAPSNSNLIKLVWLQSQVHANTCSFRARRHPWVGSSVAWLYLLVDRVSIIRSAALIYQSSLIQFLPRCMNGTMKSGTDLGFLVWWGCRYNCAQSARKFLRPRPLLIIFARPWEWL